MSNYSPETNPFTPQEVPQTLNFENTYSLEEFMAIVRGMLDRAVADRPLHPDGVKTLHAWENKVADLIDRDPELAEEMLVGFWKQNGSVFIKFLTTQPVNTPDQQ